MHGYGPLYCLAILSVSIAFAERPRVIFDGRLTLKPTKLSDSEERLLKDTVVPGARRAWHARERDAVCEPQFRPIGFDVASGAFTRPKAEQRALLYKYCTLGHNMALEGIAVIENGQLVAHVIFEGGENHAVGALPDINGNGLAEIVIAGGATNQGITSSWISIIGFGGGGITRFGQTETSSDDCGVNENNCKATQNRIWARSGKTPVFYREVFVGAASSGVKSEGIAPLSLNEDNVEYELLK